VVATAVESSRAAVVVKNEPSIGGKMEGVWFEVAVDRQGKGAALAAQVEGGSAFW
jgi:hypothetical protein